MADRLNIYECPHGCKSQGKQPVAATVRGWKKHMTQRHGGWQEAQLAAIVGNVAPSANGHGLFDADAERIISGLPGQTPLHEGKAVEEPDSSTQTAAPEQSPIKRVQLKSKKLRKFLSSLPEVFLKAKGIEPDADDKELIDTASEMLEEMFGIALEVPEEMWVIRSRWVALLIPIFAVALVWMKHEFTAQLFKSKEQAEEQKKAA